MSAEIPESYLDLLTGKVVVGLTTLLPGGQPQSTPIWIDWDGENLLVNTARGRVKDRNMEQRAPVTVLAIDPKNQFRWMEIRGEVVDSTEDGAEAHADKLSWRYINASYYDGANAERKRTENRIIYKIRPTHVIARG